MKIGKLPEPVLIRSVLKQVGHRRNEVLVGPAVGQDCAVMELEEGKFLYCPVTRLQGQRRISEDIVFTLQPMI